MCGLFWGAHKSLVPRARTLLGGLGQATLSFFAVATPLFVFFGECPQFCDLAKQRRKIVGGVSEVGKDDSSLYFLAGHGVQGLDLWKTPGDQFGEVPNFLMVAQIPSYIY